MSRHKLVKTMDLEDEMMISMVGMIMIMTRA
jgi:hypothetical protein